MFINKNSTFFLFVVASLLIVTNSSRADYGWSDSPPFEVYILSIAIPSGSSTGWADSQPFDVNLIIVSPGGSPEGSTDWADSNDFDVYLINIDRVWADSFKFPVDFVHARLAEFIRGDFTGNCYAFTVRYFGNKPLDASRLDSNDIRVVGPNSFEQSAAYVDVNIGEANTVVAKYNIIAPGSSWDPCDNGNYALFIEPNQVSDADGNLIPACTLRTFAITDNTAGEFVLENYNILSTTRVGRTIFEYVFTITLRNAGRRPVSDVDLEPFDAPSNMSIVDSTIIFEQIPAGQSATSNGSLKADIDRSVTINLYDTPWRATFDLGKGELVGDFTGDGVVDWEDMKFFANAWLSDEPTADIAPPEGDGIVNFLDFAVFARYWLGQ
jgi:hypothetical protein